MSIVAVVGIIRVGQMMGWYIKSNLYAQQQDALLTITVGEEIWLYDGLTVTVKNLEGIMGPEAVEKDKQRTFIPGQKCLADSHSRIKIIGKTPQRVLVELQLTSFYGDPPCWIGTIFWLTTDEFTTLKKKAVEGEREKAEIRRLIKEYEASQRRLIF
ncbi:MAG: hypothetical protein HYT64_02945 [Candidatus Yanofskybacteria bacterium]|nr:hypothetical protein [Candidatus Yanofskybacteria bacterium]